MLPRQGRDWRRKGCRRLLPEPPRAANLSGKSHPGVSISTGVAALEDDDTLVSLIERADGAMLQASEFFIDAPPKDVTNA